MLQAQLLSKLSGIRHGFFTRIGGVSEGIYESLNGGIGSEDFRVLNRSLQRLERFWTDQILYRL